MNALAGHLIRRREGPLKRTGLAAALMIAAVLGSTPALSAAASPVRQAQFRCLSKGGMVNAVEGEVEARTGNHDWRRVTARVELRNGDGLRTGPGSRAELLLNPGSFLRLSENTEIIYTDTSVTNLKLKLVKGTIIIEVAVNDREGYLDSVYALITLVTPSAEYAIIPGGIYRFRSDEGGGDQVMVRKGRVVVNGAVVREGKRAILFGGPPSIQEFDRDVIDQFDNWSRDRAKMHVQANKLMKEERWYKEILRGKRAVFVEERSSIQPQIKNRYIVSARAGMVSHVESASFKRSDEDWSTLAVGYDLREGDEVKLDEGSRAEIVLRPDSYLRLSGEARLIFTDTSPENVAFSLMSGSAIVELSDGGESGDRVVRVTTPHGDYSLASGGTYRFEIEPDGLCEVMVRRGQARIGSLTAREGKRIVFDGSSPKLAEFDRDAQDSFDSWSKYRGSLLAAPVRRMGRRRASFHSNRPWYCGLWFYSAAIEGFTFVPGFWDFHTPYGGRYSIKFVPLRMR
ncbi:MAG TPA: FecR domain-containing protein [Blastocatellia bacterium]|nr:FecR domain-containing protein [Blastocatellia bacterium]